jgi:hypothetical protein
VEFVSQRYCCKVALIAVTSELQVIPVDPLAHDESNTPIADPNQDSVGRTRVWASTGNTSDVFASNFMNYIIGWIWPSGISLDWVRGRQEPMMLAWSSLYPSFPSATDVSPRKALLSVRKFPIGAISDGSLQIQGPDNVDGGRMVFSRQYYVVPLEVLSPFSVTPLVS